VLLLSKLQLELGLVTATGRHSGTRANFNVVFLPGGLAHGGAAIFHSPGPVQGGLGQEPDLPRREGPLPVGCAWPHALLRRVLVDYSVRDLPVRPRIIKKDTGHPWPLYAKFASSGVAYPHAPHALVATHECVGSAVIRWPALADPL
jgi:hypothetical protein